VLTFLKGTLCVEPLTRITQAVEGIAMRNSENEQATADQRMVAGEIETNVAKISQSANETAEGARQTVSASRKMAHLAEKLLEATRSFVV
jgi:methyl-accepting chemotaxis protein